MKKIAHQNSIQKEVVAPQKCNFPLSEKEILANITPFTAHADLITKMELIYPHNQQSQCN